MCRERPLPEDDETVYILCRTLRGRLDNPPILGSVARILPCKNLFDGWIMVMARRPDSCADQIFPMRREDFFDCFRETKE